MKKLKLTETDKQNLLKEFQKELENYNPADDKQFVFTPGENKPSKDKIHILYTPQAYLRAKTLVDEFSGEVGWNGLVRKLSEDTYQVYDILVYPQTVNGARTLDPTKENEWYEKYGELIREMRVQAHSHVSMATTPSGTDMDNQKSTVQNINSGIMLFQIWNKHKDINSFLYDLDKGLLYDRNDIEVDIQNEGEFDTLKKFLENARKMVEPIKYQQPNIKPLVYSQSAAPVNTMAVGYQWNPPKEWKEQKELSPFYWKDSEGNEGW